MLPELLANTNGAIAQLTAPLTAEATTIEVSAPAPVPLHGEGQFRIQVGEELMLVDGPVGTSTKWTVERGIEETAKAAHAAGEAVFHYLTAGGVAAVIADAGGVLSVGAPPSTSAGVLGQFAIEHNEADEATALYGPKREAVTPNAFPSTPLLEIPPAYQGNGSELKCALLAGTYAESEVYATVGTPPGAAGNDSILLYIRASGNFATGYRLKIGETYCALYTPAGKIGEVASLKYHTAAGDKWGIRAEGHHLTVYQRPASTGEWQVLLEVLDTTYSSGQVGAGTYTTPESISTFGGGTIVSEENPTWGQPVSLIQVAIPVAKPTGVASVDTANVKAAIKLGQEAEKAKLNFQAGKYLINETLTMYSYQHWEGAGEEITTLELAAGVDADLVQTQGFSEQTGHGKAGGPRSWSIREMTLDGNGGEQSKTTASWPLRIYGRAFKLENMSTQHGAYGGLWCEWSESEDALPEHEEIEECMISKARFENYYGPAESVGQPVYGVYWNGPHDSKWTDVLVQSFYPQHSGEAVYAFGVYVAKGAENLETKGLHVYGRHSHGVYHEEAAKGEHLNLYFEGAKKVNLVVSGGTTVMGGFSIGTDGNSGTQQSEIGIQLGDTEAEGYKNVKCGGAQISGVYLEAFSENKSFPGYEGRCVHFANDTGGNTVQVVQAANNALTLYSGTYASTDTLMLVPQGAAAEGLYQYQGKAPGASIQVFTKEEKWKKPAGCSGVMATCIGAGGGGGSGAVREAGKIAGGGAGGGGGGYSSGVQQASTLPAEITVQVGAGGAGGKAISAENTAGEAGKAGGSTSFTGVLANGGGGGQAGKLNSGSEATEGGAGGGAETQVGPAGGAPSKSGEHGEAPSVTNQRTAGGGSGGGVTAGNVAEKGGAGGKAAAGSIAGGAAGAAEEAGKAGTGTSTNGAGSGGGGGGGGNAANAGKGGAGGNYGAGGGGGGGARNGHESGAGGEGAPGICIVTTW